MMANLDDQQDSSRIDNNYEREMNFRQNNVIESLGFKVNQNRNREQILEIKGLQKEPIFVNLNKLTRNQTGTANFNVMESADTSRENYYDYLT